MTTYKRNLYSTSVEKLKPHLSASITVDLIADTVGVKEESVRQGIFQLRPLTRSTLCLLSARVKNKIRYYV